jgi:hypothetical protein
VACVEKVFHAATEISRANSVIPYSSRTNIFFASCVKYRVKAGFGLNICLNSTFKYL